jgi:hypothetical protein
VAAVGGAVAGVVTPLVPSLLSSRAAFDFLAVWLGVTAGVYRPRAVGPGPSPSWDRHGDAVVVGPGCLGSYILIRL